MHDRVADEHHLHQIAGLDPGGRGQFQCQRIDRLAHGAGHFHIAAGVHHRVTYPAHQILAKPDLRVHHTRRRLDRAIAQVGQVGCNGGRAQVDGQPINPAFIEAGPDVQYLMCLVPVAFVQGDGDGPVALAQRGLQTAQHGQGGGDAGHIPLIAQGKSKAFEIAGGFVHVGFLHLDIVQVRRGVHDDDPVRCLFADHLPVHL